MSVTVDANILVYASNQADPAHDRARTLLTDLAAGPQLLYLFWPTLLAYVRIVTHPAILPGPRPPREVIANVTALLEPAHVRCPGELDGFWDAFRAVAGDHSRGNAVPDAHIAALMLQHGVGTIYTRDRDFRRFDAITVRDPFA